MPSKRRAAQLRETHPTIFADWDNDGNAHIDSSSVVKTSKALVWWRCPRGHRYQVSVFSRVRSNGCRICAAAARKGRFVRGTKRNTHTLAELNPDFLKEWHKEKNAPLMPNDLAAGSHRRIWWRCSQAHEWEASVHSRLDRGPRKGHNCPVCARATQGARIRRSRLARSGPLTEAFPLVAAEWDHERNSEPPSAFSPKSNKKVRWVCKFGHCWEATITNRTHNESGCPYCTNQSSRLEIFLLCELRSIFQEVSWRKKIEGDECDLFIPSINTAIEIDGSYWHRSKLTKDLEKSDRLRATGIDVIRIRQTGLPAIEGNAEVIAYKHDRDRLAVCIDLCRKLASKNPNTALLRYIGDARIVADNDFKKMVARLPAPPAGLTLADKFPAISREWNFKANMPLTPDLFSPNSEQSAYWLCPNGHNYNSTIKNRTARGSGCPACYRENLPANTRIARAKRTVTLAAANPSFLSMWDNEKNIKVKPVSIAAKSGYVAYWSCRNGHSFKKAIGQMFKNSDCPSCNSLAYRFPIIATEWVRELNGDKTPWTVAAMSGYRAWWRCKNGHMWRTSVSTRTAATGSGCKQCYDARRGETIRKSRAISRGSLEKENPPFLAEWAFDMNSGISPAELTAKSGYSPWWRCPNGHVFKQPISDRSNGRGCPDCANQIRPEKTRLSILKRRGSLAEHFPQISQQWHSIKNGLLTPESVTSGSKQRVWWLCPNGHEWIRSCNDRTTHFKRTRRLYCPMCD